MGKKVALASKPKKSKIKTSSKPKLRKKKDILTELESLLGLKTGTLS